jgi:hypothetical protein
MLSVIDADDGDNDKDFHQRPCPSLHSSRLQKGITCLHQLKRIVANNPVSANGQPGIVQWLQKVGTGNEWQKSMAAVECNGFVSSAITLDVGSIRGTFPCRGRRRSKSE